MPEWRINRLRGRYCIVWDDSGIRRRYSLGTADRSKAEARAPALYAELTRPDDQSVYALWHAYLSEKADRPVALTMQHTWKALAKRFGKRTAETITLADCQAQIQERRNTGISDGTIHTELGHLRTVLNWAVKRRLITHAPHIERPSKPAPKDGFLMREEARRMIEAVQENHVRLAIRLMLATGARAGAVTGLTWDRVDFDRRIINLRDASLVGPRKGRATVPMNDSILEALAEAKRTALTDHVIEYAGRPVDSLKKGIKTAATKIGRPDVSAHTLRHTAAVWLAEDGHSMEEIAQYLGHSNSRITAAIYARYSPTHLRKLSATLEI